jgi:periplasmic protein TonB
MDAGQVDRVGRRTISCALSKMQYGHEGVSGQVNKINDIGRSQPLMSHAWGISLILHSVVIGLALTYAAHIELALREEVFTWDVAIVEAIQPSSKSEQLAPVATPVQPRTSVKPKNKRVSRNPLAERPTEIKSKPPIEPRIVEVAESTTWRPAEPKEPEPATVATSPEMVEGPSVQHEQEADAAGPASSKNADADPQESPTQMPVHKSGTDVTPMPDAKATGPSSNTPADHRWLVELLWRKVAELKSYPNAARMNGQEGKVILKAVIRSDGYLADVSVLKSSGHELLDGAAIEAVKLACPLHMKHAIGKPQIVVSLPIAYSLAK